MISVFVALSQTPTEAASSRTRGLCVAWSACLAPSLRRVVREAECPGFEPATYWLQVQRHHFSQTLLQFIFLIRSFSFIQYESLSVTSA